MKAAVEQIFNSVIPDVTVYDSTKVTIPPAPSDSAVEPWRRGYRQVHRAGTSRRVTPC